MKQYFQSAKAKRVASLALVLGLAWAASLTFDATPRDQPVRLHLAEALRASAQSIQLTYLDGDEAILGTEQRFSGPAPAVLDSLPSLAPGRYQLRIELRDHQGAVRRIERSVTVPTEGAVRIRIEAP